MADRFLRMQRRLSATELADFEATWEKKWPDLRPNVSAIRASESYVPVTFRTFIESKFGSELIRPRFGERNVTHTSLREIILKHLQILRMLQWSYSANRAGLVVITRSLEGPKGIAESPVRTYWKSVHENSGPGENPQEVHLYLTLIDPRYFDLVPYILADGTCFAEAVLICPLSLQYVYSPGRLGADIAAESEIVKFAKMGPFQWIGNKKDQAGIKVKSMKVDWKNYVGKKKDPNFLGSNRTPKLEELEELHWRWEQGWFDRTLTGEQFRGSGAGTHWLRLHNLPESKRYPDSEAEYQEVGHRQLTLVRELCTRFGSSPDELLVLTPSVSETDVPSRREFAFREILPEARCWQSLPYDLTGRNSPTWAHVFVSEVSLDDARMRQLLRAAADGLAWDVVIFPPTLEWTFHPYDGGNDIVCFDEDFVDELQVKYKDWLPTHPSGL